MSDLRSVFKEMVGEVLENGLEAELDDELGYSKYDYRNKDTENSRNGHSRKTMKTSAGEVEIAVPRDRNGEFEPRLVKKNETTLSGDIEEKIISVGVTESGEGYCMIPIPWENTATAYNMKIPNVYISKDDLFDEKLMAKLKEYKVIGFYFDVPLDDYSFLKNFSIFAI